MIKCALCGQCLSKTSIRSFNVPKDKDRRLKWSRICGIQFCQSSRICEKHFSRSDIITAGRRLLLMPKAVPSVEYLQEYQENNSVISSQMFVPEDCVMDFKAEELRSQPSVFEIEETDSDNTTLSASEASLTPHLLCKLRKARVRIKKLPAHILEKYNLKMKKSSKSTSPIQPCRTSKRLGAKSMPTGHYLSLHKNKPLKELFNKQKQKKLKKNRNWLNLKQYKHLPSSIQSTDKSSSIESNNNQVKPTNAFKEPQKSSVIVKPLTSLTNSIKGLPLDNPGFVNSNLHEKIISTRQINLNLTYNQPLTTTITLPNYPEVVITRYELPTHDTTDCTTPKIANSSNVSLFNNTSLQSPTVTSNINVPSKPLPITNTPMLQPNVYPMIISSMNRLNETPYQPPIVTSANNVINNENLVQQPYKRLPHLSTTVQTITRPPKISKNNSNTPVIVDSPKVLFIQQPAQKNDLNMPPNKQGIDNLENIQDDSDIDSVNSSERISLSTETDKRPKPEVIKRIIYHTKAAQTKFTCPSNICGLVDTDGFKLNCFYCYDIFPLHKWLEFKNHIIQMHHIEEKAIASDSEEVLEEDCENLDRQDGESITSNKDSDVEINENIDLNSNIGDTNGKVGKKSRLSNTTMKSLNKSSCNKLNASHNTNKLNHSLYDIVSLNSGASDNDEDLLDINGDNDNSENHIEFPPKPSKLEEPVKVSGNKHLNNSVTKKDDATKLLPPSLSHIKIQKVLSPPANTSVNTAKLSPQNNSPKKETFIKIPSNFNIQNVIKTIPNSTTIDEIKTNGKPRPRYFVVKKILKAATTDKKPNINISKGSIITKIPAASPENHIINVDDDMPVNDENEDKIPQPTKGRGILFGITNRMVVVEFLLKLKTYPELWRPLAKNYSMAKYDESIRKLCEHLNNRFDLKIENYEMRLSIQRVKDWYCRMLNNIYVHNLKSNNFEPYPHTFPLYFKILNQFLTSDINSGMSVINMQNKSKTLTAPKALETSKEVLVTSSKFKTSLSNTNSTTTVNTTNSTSSSLTVSTPSPVSPVATDEDSAKQQENVDNTDNNVDNLIEFDGDNLFDTSDDEILSEFDETEWPTIKPTRKTQSDPFKPKKTKIYTGRFECDMCQKIFKRGCDLRRHRVHHFPPKYQCSICLQKFFFKFWAEKCNHQKKKQLHLGAEDDSDGNSTLADGSERPKHKWPKKMFRFKMICEICGASYRSIGSLNSHKRDKHLNQRLKCIVCNFTALTNYRIVQHQKKRHIVEPGTVEEVAKKSRARMDSKTPFTVEARQEFDWRREMRAKLKPGEIFFGCCKCRLVFNSRKEKILHNKMEHPIKETTVLCLLCLPNKMLLSNSNGARRHYTDIHKVPWDEIDALVKRTKPIFNILSKEEIELLNASQNYKELLEEMLKDREIEPKLQKVEIIDQEEEEEALKAIQNLPPVQIKEKEETMETQANYKIDVVYSPEQVPEEEQDQNVFVDGIIDHDYNNEEEYQNNEHNYNSEEQFVVSDTVEQEAEQNYLQQNPQEAQGHLAYHIEYTEVPITREEEEQEQQNDLEYMQGISEDFVEGELADGDLVEECIVVEEECIDDVVQVGEEYY